MACIIRRSSPRRRWVAITPVEVTPPSGTGRSPGTVVSKLIMAEPPTTRPPANAPGGGNPLATDGLDGRGLGRGRCGGGVRWRPRLRAAVPDGRERLPV